MPEVLKPVLVLLLGVGPIWLMLWWVTRRDRRRSELQQQIWELERAIEQESWSEEERERDRQAKARYAEIQREARRRLGLPEDAPAPGKKRPWLG